MPPVGIQVKDKLLAVEASDKRTWNTVIRILALNEPARDIDVWKEPDVLSGHAHIRVPARDLNGVLREFDRRNISHYIVIDNIQRLIDGSGRDNATTSRMRRSEGSEEVVGRYARYDELGVPGKNKWRIWLDGGIHAREWISPATVISVAHQLLEGYETSDEGRRFLTDIDWYILPVANPDGYEYSHVMERLWRKNRRPVTKHCTGVDLNRNWDFHWGGVNADRDPCSNIFRGDKAESEPEVNNIINFLLPRADAFLAFLSLHSYYQLVTTRWAYDYNTNPPDHKELLAVAQQMVAAMSDTHNMSYQAGSAPELLYPYSGGSGDWARGTANITYAYLVELRDKGHFGFLLPSDQIVPVGEEMWAGMKVVARQILTKHSNATVPAVIPDVTYRGDDVTTTSTIRVTTRVRVTTRGFTRQRVTVKSTTPQTVHQTKTQIVSSGPTTRRFQSSTTDDVTPTMHQTKTQIVSSGPTTRRFQSRPTDDVTQGDRSPSSEELDNEGMTSTASSSQGNLTHSSQATSGQSSSTQTSPRTNWTIKVRRGGDSEKTRDAPSSSMVNGSCRTCRYVILNMLVGFCVCLKTALVWLS
ncbi:Carboxypeptidase A2 [Lamellibrachia satsuma]|nr:Carboxypeptidase A2 [Lamellibrachia satsuma]